MASPSRAIRMRRRRGTTAVEVAVILPIFFTFVFGIIEFGRVQLVSNMLKTACRNAARYASTEGVSTSGAQARVAQVLGTVLDPNDVTVLVKDAAVFDNGGQLPESASEYSSMPDLSLDDATPRQLFLIRASVEYNDVAFLPFPVLEGVTLHGQAFMRHE